MKGRSSKEAVFGIKDQGLVTRHRQISIHTALELLKTAGRLAPCSFIGGWILLVGIRSIDHAHTPTFMAKSVIHVTK